MLSAPENPKELRGYQRHSICIFWCALSSATCFGTFVYRGINDVSGFVKRVQRNLLTPSKSKKPGTHRGCNIFFIFANGADLVISMSGPC